MTHCTKCGAELARVTRSTGRYDPFTGAPTQYGWLVCPHWRSRWGFGNGHGWQYRGEYRIDGEGRPDPTVFENPPRPPLVGTVA